MTPLKDEGRAPHTGEHQRPPIAARREVFGREEDVQAANIVANTASWIRRGPRLLVAAFAFVSGTAATAAWFGAQSSSPAQRITRLEFRVDSGFRAITKDIDDVRVQQQESKLDRESLTEKVDLLLRLNCPNITRADLIRACRLQGVTP